MFVCVCVGGCGGKGNLFERGSREGESFLCWSGFRCGGGVWVECEGVLGVSWRVKLGGGDWDPEASVRVGSLWRMSEAWEWMSWVV